MHTALNFKLWPRFKICRLPSYGVMNMHNPTVAVFKVASFTGFTAYSDPDSVCKTNHKGNTLLFVFGEPYGLLLERYLSY
jgi:hypothetical protein